MSHARRLQHLERRHQPSNETPAALLSERVLEAVGYALLRMEEQGKTEKLTRMRAALGSEQVDQLLAEAKAEQPPE